MDKIQIIEKLFSYIVTCSYLLIPIGFFFLKGRKKEAIPICIAIYGVLCFLLLIYFDQFLPIPFRRYYFAFYTTFEYSVFAFIFWQNITSKKLRQLLIFFSLLFLVFQVVYLFTTKTITLDSVPIGIETILILIYIFFFFYEFSKKPNGSFIYSHYGFWIAVGVLVYLGGSFFFYILFNHLNEEEINTFGKVTYLAEIIKNVLFMTALFVYAKQPVKNKNESASVPYLDMI